MKIEINDLEEYKKSLDIILNNIPYQESAYDSEHTVLFFPVSFEKKKIETESGVSMFASSMMTSSGISSLTVYGLMADPRDTDSVFSAAYFNESSAIRLDMNDFINVLSILKPEMKYDDVKKLETVDCFILKKSSILFNL